MSRRAKSAARRRIDHDCARSAPDRAPRAQVRGLLEAEPAGGRRHTAVAVADLLPAHVDAHPGSSASSAAPLERRGQDRAARSRARLRARRAPAATPPTRPPRPFARPAASLCMHPCAAYADTGRWPLPRRCSSPMPRSAASPRGCGCSATTRSICARASDRRADPPCGRRGAHPPDTQHAGDPAPRACRRTCSSRATISARRSARSSRSAGSTHRPRFSCAARAATRRSSISSGRQHVRACRVTSARPRARSHAVRTARACTGRRPTSSACGASSSRWDCSRGYGDR